MKEEKLDALIFIDTNIMLDFYRIRKSDISMKYLEQIESHIDLIITSSQVEMEFKKNRQSTILESIGEINKINNVNLNIPAILSTNKSVEIIKKSKKEIDLRQKKLKEQIERILTSPKTHDPVYKSLQKLFSNKTKINLNRENSLRFEIRNLAKKRFILGYPPRKKSDNSIGDSVNWEWLIKCSQITGKHIIIVSRDGDFGATYDNNSYLNDWLQQEFRQRVGTRKKIILTEKLSHAFKLVQIPVTPEMIEEEENIIKFSFEDSQKRIKESMKALAEIVKSNYNLKDIIKNSEFPK